MRTGLAGRPALVASRAAGNAEERPSPRCAARPFEQHPPIPTVSFPAWLLGWTCRVVVAAALAGAIVAQAAPPGGASPTWRAWTDHGQQLLDGEDPLGAREAYRRALQLGVDAAEPRVGLGRAHLMLGHSQFALAYGEAAIALDSGNQDGMALVVRALIRAREFDAAVQRSDAWLQSTTPAGAELLAARGSALFRVQRIEDAAVAYRRVVAQDPLQPEAHLRLGSGLLPPTTATISAPLRAAVDALLAGDRGRAIERLRSVLRSEPNHPIAHRLLGETLFAQRTATGMVSSEPAFAALAELAPRPDVRRLPVVDFVPAYRSLSPSRRAVVDRTMAMFGSYLGKLVAIGGRHDLLGELERTTDAEARATLRGRRTFDGRVWDDVRGVGGPQAATGIEALDDAAWFGFDTFAHEVAHQVHFYAFTPLQRARIRSLYQAALAEGRCLDYYAASNEAEYFGQGVEAFASLCKRPGGETTHGHTRFELFSVDPALHDFIAGVVDFDPLRDERLRQRLLEAAIAVALRCGRPGDAVVAARMLSPGPERERLLAEAQRVERAQRCH